VLVALFAAALVPTVTWWASVPSVTSGYPASAGCRAVAGSVDEHSRLRAGDDFGGVGHDGRGCAQWELHGVSFLWPRQARGEVVVPFVGAQARIDPSPWCLVR